MKINMKWNDKVKEPKVDPDDIFANLPDKARYDYSDPRFHFTTIEIEIDCEDPEVMKAIVAEMSKINE